MDYGTCQTIIMMRMMMMMMIIIIMMMIMIHLYIKNGDIPLQTFKLPKGNVPFAGLRGFTITFWFFGGEIVLVSHPLMHSCWNYNGWCFTCTEALSQQNDAIPQLSITIPKWFVFVDITQDGSDSLRPLAFRLLRLALRRSKSSKSCASTTALAWESRVWSTSCSLAFGDGGRRVEGQGLPQNDACNQDVWEIRWPVLGLLFLGLGLCLYRACDFSWYPVICIYI